MIDFMISFLPIGPARRLTPLSSEDRNQPLRRVHLPIPIPRQKQHRGTKSRVRGGDSNHQG